MKKIIVAALILISFFVLSGCTEPLQDDVFTYYDGYNDETVKYFDSYAVVYENEEYDLTLYAVKSSDIRDDYGDEYINYLLRWNINKLNNFSLKCGNHSLWSGSIEWNGIYRTHLIPGQEIYDYCQSNTYFTLEVHGENIADINIYSNTNQSQLDWHPVSNIGENNIGVYIATNLNFILSIIVIFFGGVLIMLLYVIVYKQNYNNFTLNKKVRKLPKISIVFTVIIIIGLIAIIAVVGSYDAPTNHYENNFYDYVMQEQSTYYLPEFRNDSYELIDSAGRLEVYIEKNGSDEITFYVVLVDHDISYLMDAMMFSFPDSANNDSYRVELHQKQQDDGGYVFGYIIEAYKNIDGMDVKDFSLSLGVTKNIDGTLTFIDFLDSTDSYDVYYENAKGFYRILYLENTIN